MKEEEVTDLMKSSISEEDWNRNCDIVKERCGGYPSFWYAAIVLSGLAGEVSSSWGGTDKIQIAAL